MRVIEVPPGLALPLFNFVGRRTGETESATRSLFERMLLSVAGFAVISWLTCGLSFDGSAGRRHADRGSVEEITDLDVAHVVAFGEHPNFPWLFSPSPN